MKKMKPETQLELHANGKSNLKQRSLEEIPIVDSNKTRCLNQEAMAAELNQWDADDEVSSIWKLAADCYSRSINLFETTQVKIEPDPPVTPKTFFREAEIALRTIKTYCFENPGMTLELMDPIIQMNKASKQTWAPSNACKKQ